MANQLVGPIHRRDQKSKYGQWTPLVSAAVGTYVAMGVMLAIGFALYMLLLMSPELLNRFLQDVIKCEDFPRYLSPNSSDAEDVEYSDHSYVSFSPPSPTVHDSDDNKTITATTFPDDTGLEAAQSIADIQAVPEKRIRVLLGIFIMAWNIKQRHLLRMAYGLQSSNDVDVDVRFIMGALEDSQAYYKPIVESDNATFGDIIVLNCSESINDGKTFTYFSNLPALVGWGNYDYVMKADDDSYIRIANLGKALKPLPRTDLYYGYSLPCGNQDPYSGWMAGAGYLLSWDLVEWIAESPIPRNRTIGPEDKLTGDWFNEGGVAKNRATSFGLLYDDIAYGGETNCARELSLDSVLIHKLKTIDQWHYVLAFFLTPRSDSLP